MNSSLVIKVVCYTIYIYTYISDGALLIMYLCVYVYARVYHSFVLSYKEKMDEKQKLPCFPRLLATWLASYGCSHRLSGHLTWKQYANW